MKVINTTSFTGTPQQEYFYAAGLGNSTTHKYADMTSACWFVVGAGSFASTLLMFTRTEYHRRTSELNHTPSINKAVEKA